MATEIQNHTGGELSQQIMDLANAGDDVVVPPAVPARSLAKLVLGAPKEWSGTYFNTYDENVVAPLVGKVFE